MGVVLWERLRSSLLWSLRFWHSFAEFRRLDGREVLALLLILRNAAPLVRFGRVLVTRVILVVYV